MRPSRSPRRPPTRRYRPCRADRVGARGPATSALVTVTLQRVKQAWSGIAVKVYLKVDGEQVGAVKNGETIELQIAAGHRSMQAKGGGASSNLTKPPRRFSSSTWCSGQPVTLRVRIPMTGRLELVRLV